MHDPELIDFAKKLGDALNKRVSQPRHQNRRTYYRVLDALFRYGKAEAKQSEITNPDDQAIAGHEKIKKFLAKIELWAGDHLATLQKANANLAKVDDSEPSEEEIKWAEKRVESAQDSLIKSLSRKQKLPNFDEDELSILHQVYLSPEKHAELETALKEAEGRVFPRRVVLGTAGKTFLGLGVASLAGAGALSVWPPAPPPKTREQDIEDKAEVDLNLQRKTIAKSSDPKYLAKTQQTMAELLEEEQRLVATFKQFTKNRELAGQLSFDDTEEWYKERNATLQKFLVSGGLATIVLTLLYSEDPGVIGDIDKSLLLRINNLATRLGSGLDSLLEEIAFQTQPPKREK